MFNCSALFALQLQMYSIVEVFGVFWGLWGEPVHFNLLICHVFRLVLATRRSISKTHYLGGQIVKPSCLSLPAWLSCKCAVAPICTVRVVHQIHVRLHLTPPGAQHPSEHGLCCGPSSLGRLPSSSTAVQDLEKGVEHPGHQYWRVPPPQTRTIP